MNRTLPFLIIAAALAACAQHQAEQYRDVTTTEAAALSVQPDVLVMDVRTPEEYAAGHLKGAQLTPVDQVLSGAAKLPADKNQKIVVYCKSGGRSSRASTYLAGHGYSNINNMAGGITAWQSAGNPVVK